ncbi:TetR/AcrR family transcriptional regulator [Runella salmonicolor]|uniref:TetR/AcrR family transcriptional regulator n=1 Tax=Runella salmonicolor TaxID=2950278 RepID=A0ABT1FRF9_9BACT|nr:TetR/AcrR family transcriptional regulator [Runella salmonicolor]MCP1384080.1 TetR/AcrR family transcriptional regulator [Runella salmonicolor]
MTEIELSTEEKILKAAEEVFMRDGYDGSRMQDIADVAGINKALLHYYFRSKDKLFEKVFDAKIQSFFPKMGEKFSQDIPFVDKIHIFIEGYMDLLLKNPYLPLFVLNTVNNKDKSAFIKKLPIELSRQVAQSYYVEFKKGNVRELNPAQFIMSLMGMCIFPFLAKPILLDMFKADNDTFDKLMEERIQELKHYVTLILTP